jgi:MoxR-like ATPase
MNLRERLNIIKNLKQDECWYITRQSLKFSDLCYAAYILDLYNLDPQGLNFSDFFNSKAVNFGISSNHRMTNNCYYLGLLKKTGNGQYSNAIHTEVYYEIKNRVNCNFNDTALYEDIIIKQIEKLFISHFVDEELEGIRRKYKIHPTIYLYKILLTIGDFTGDYSISIKEFKIFIGTSLDYYYYNNTVSLILESRDDQSLYKTLINSIDQNNFNGNRFNLLFENLPSIIIQGNNIKLNKDFIEELRTKISIYESNYKSNIDVWSTIEFQNSTNSLFINKKNKKIEDMNTSDLNVIYFGPPGTGKTYTTIAKAISIVNPSFDLNQERKEIKAEYDRLIEEGLIVFTTFHQSMSYEDFIEGIKPETIENEVVYNIKNGIFKNICQAALTPNQLDFNTAYEKLKRELTIVDQIELYTPKGKAFSISLNSNDNLTLHTGPSKEKQGTLTKENIQKQINGETKFIGWEGYFKGVVDYLVKTYNYNYQSSNISQNFVLIIDEINRGNVSAIFGELITLIEDDKRLGKTEGLEVMLPYSKEKFGVPPNLFIIGTMNTADRSVEALDTALRRRFSFEEMPPNYELEGLEYKIFGHSALDVLKTINKRIEKLLDKDHSIGHSYFLNKDEDKIILSFYKNIIPLLQEYFFGDYGKIGLVLGIGFVQQNDWDDDDKFFADFNEESTSDYDDRNIFKIIDYRKNKTGFADAINKLMNL